MPGSSALSAGGHRAYPQMIVSCAMRLWIRFVIYSGLAVFASTVVFAQMAPPAAAPSASQSQGPFELVDPKVFRVCADPRNLPYSDTNGAGFENRIAEL